MALRKRNAAWEILNGDIVMKLDLRSGKIKLKMI